MDNEAYAYPSDKEIERYLDIAFARMNNTEGVIFIDTAAAYGLSEERLGAYLRRHPEKLARTFICTKWGEDFDIAEEQSSVDHSVGNLHRSAQRSASRLGKIDLLYLHKTNVEVLRDKQVIEAMKKMKEEKAAGIRFIGASIFDEIVLEAAVKEGLIDDFDAIQMPSPVFIKRPDLIEVIYKRGIAIVINSPIRKGGNRAPGDIFAELLQREEISVILTGTRHHLEETISYIPKNDTEGSLDNGGSFDAAFKGYYDLLKRLRTFVGERIGRVRE